VNHLLKSCLIFVILCLSSLGHASQVSPADLTAEEKAFLRLHPVITLGSDANWSPYVIKNADGTVTGYDKDVLDLVNERTGANFQLVAGTWKQMLDRATSRDIDGLSTSAVHKSREAEFNFSNIYISTQRLLAVSTTNPQNITSVDDLAGKRIGYQEKNLFDKKLVSRFTSSTIVPLASLEEILQHLITGKIDATVGSHALIYLASSRGLPYVKIADYIPDSRLDLVFSIRKDWPLAVSILNKGLAAIEEEKSALRKKWFFAPAPAPSEDTYAPLNLSKEEQDWLAAKPYLSVMSLQNFHPFNFRKHDIPMGYSIDMVKRFGKMLDKEIRFIKKPWNAQLEMLKQGKLDLIPHLAVTEERKAFAEYTDFIHLTFMIGFAVHKDREINSMADLTGKPLAVVNGYYLHRHLEKNFPEIPLLPVKSTEEAIDAVARGNAFAVVDNIPTLNYFIQEKWLGNLKIASVSDFGLPLETRLPMGVTKGNTHLISILEKANAAVPIDQVTTLRRTWMLPDHNRTIALSREEKAYLRKKKRITMCIDPNWMPFEANEKGRHTGMTADYIQLMQQAIGIPIEFIPTTTWTESIEMGMARKCDIFALVMETPERRSYLDFTTPYFKTPLVIATQLHVSRISDIRDVADRRIGIAKGYAYGELLRKKYPDMQLIDTDSVTDGLNRVEKGTLFGFIGTHAALGYHIQKTYFGQLKIAGKFNEIWELGVGTRNDEPLLKSVFNKAIAAIPEEEHRRILNQWIVVGSGDTSDNTLSKSDKTFIKAHPVIRFRVSPNRPPFEMIRDGKAAGLAVDYINAIAERTGFTPRYVASDKPISDAYETIANDRTEFDTLAFSVKSKEREKRFAYGDAFMSYPMMIIAHKDSPYIGKTADLNNKRVAVEKGFLTNTWLNRDYPKIRIVPVNDTKAALTMVNEGQVDAYVGNIAVANYMMTHGNLRHLKIVAPSDYGNVQYRFIAPKEWPELISILNKGYRSLSPEFHTLTQQKWFSVQMVERVDYRLLWQGAAAAGLIVAWILWWNRKLFAQKEKTEKALTQLQAAQVELEEKNQMLENLSVTDQLTGLYNRLKLDAVLEEEFQRSKRYGNVFGVIMTDIDHFKRVNDTYGHQAGDMVLTGFAALLKNNVRTVDTVGRWGGEEFLIICPETDRDGLVHVAENLRRVIADHTFETVEQITASFGATLYGGQPTVDAMVSRADEALYVSKENGRNKVTLKT